MNSTRPIKSIIVLTAICLITAALLAAVNYITDPIIAKAEKQKENENMRVVLPDGGEFEAVDLSTLEGLPTTVKSVWRETSGKGYVFSLSTTGYASGLNIMCGVSADGKVSGAVCLASGETLGKEKTYGESLAGKTKGDIMDADTVSGATLSTKAYRAAVADALDAFMTISEKEGK